MGHEIAEDPSDVLYHVVNTFLSHGVTEVTYFLAFYFIFWGFLDVFLSICLLREKLWAFPLSVLLIGIFLLYELFRFSYTHSYILLGVILADLCILILILKEWNLIKKTHGA